MLSTLTVQNVALIDKLELDLKDGLNILSGETGAGKSIIIDSVGFVLGERADKSLIRYGTDFATVEAVFSDYLTPAVSMYLEENGIEAEEILIIRRKMTVDGKNESRINGRLTTLSILRGLTELLVDLHGQHEHQSLLRVSSHLGLLDELGGEKIISAKNKVKVAYEDYSALREEQKELGNEEERVRRIDILTYQLNEIDRARIKLGEEDELLEKRKRIRNQEKILSVLNSAKDALDGYESSAVTVALKNTAASLESISDFHRDLSDIADMLLDCKQEVMDALHGIRRLLDELDYDSSTANEIEERLELVRMMQRKYGGDASVIDLFYENGAAELYKLQNASERVEELSLELEKAARLLTESAKDLSTLRILTAERFEKAILSELNDLGMSGSTFKVQITSTENADEIHSDGGDEVEFLISPNKGEPLKPLAKIISGGEMSRFMLALKNIVADIDGIGTMIFDEIDTGISGNISAVVAEKMCNISRKRQVIAVTHMPSLAAMADSHYLIEKSEENGKTLTHLTLLSDDTDEIARLIGGKDYSTYAVPHAHEMKAWAERYKKSLK